MSCFIKIKNWFTSTFGWKYLKSVNAIYPDLSRIEETDRMLQETLVSTREISSRLINLLDKSPQNSRQKWNNAFNALSDVIIATNEIGVITEFNKSAENTFGRCRSDVIGKNINMLLPTVFCAKQLCQLKQNIAAYKEQQKLATKDIHSSLSNYMQDITVVDQIGKILYFEISVTVISTKPNNEIMFIAVMRDRTFQKDGDRRSDRHEQLVDSMLHSMPNLTQLKNINKY